MNWLARIFRTRTKRPLHPTPRRVRPQVEILEDRLAPATFNVTSTVDSASLTSGSLRAAILLADSTPGPNVINVPAGTYNLTLTSNGTHDGTTGALLIENQDLTINGLGTVVINANAIDRVFDIEGTSVINVDFNGLTITGGIATIYSNQGAHGGGIYVNNNSVLTLTDTLVTHNGSDINGGGIYTRVGALAITGGGVNDNTAAAEGGGIYTSGGNITLTSTTVNNNASSSPYGGGGGGIYNSGIASHGNLSLVATTVSGNTVNNSTFNPDNGGGIADYAYGGSISITAGSRIINNAANNYGGGIYAVVQSFTIANSTVSNNTALNGTGGGVYDNNNSQTLDITNSTFANNTTSNSNGYGGYGGGLYATVSSVTLAGDTFSANAAAWGGGLYVGGGTLSVSGGSFTGNLATGGTSKGALYGYGGGLYAQGNASVTLGNVAFSSNTAGYGGGLYLDHIPTVKLASSTFTDNRANASGGGLYALQVANATFGNLTFTGNIAGPNGGGLAFDGTNLTVTNSTFTDNAASGNTTFNGGGGAYYNQYGGTAGTLTVANSTFTGNSAATGGGLFLSNNSVQSTLAIIDSSFNYNKAAFIGGGIYANEIATDTITNVNLIGNIAGADDGGGYFSGTTFTMTYGNVYGNVSGYKGGFKADVNTATIAHTTISDNRAATTAGGLYLITSVSGTLSFDTIANNQATNAGSGVYWDLTSGTGTMSNTTVSGNLGGSGASLHGGGTLTIIGSTFSNNRTSMDGGAIYTTIGTLYLTNDTIQGNTSGTQGGGLYVSSGSVYLTSDTIGGNNAHTGGGIYNSSDGSVYLTSSIIAANTATTGADLYGTFSAGASGAGYNLIGVLDPTNVSYTVGTKDHVGSLTTPLSPDLGPLQNNGGPTFTQALLPGSLAIDNGSINPTVTTDQRGFPRSMTTPSIGAFEPQTPLGTSPNAIYVESLYETLLNRVADPGAAGWVNLLNSGTPASSVILDIEHSTEYLDDVVNNLYNHYLHRNVDPAGLTGWVNLLANGGTIEQVTQGITGSPEYFGLHGGSNAAFVAALYVDVLNRAPDAAGLAGWTNALNNGTSTAAVAGAFLGSQEYRTDLVESYYENYLGRQADPAGLAGWVAALNAGTADQVVLAAILGSPEAYGNRS